MNKKPSPETIVARDSSQMYLLNRIAQTVIANDELYDKTKVATEQLAHRKTGDFEPVVFSGLDAEMLLGGLRTVQEFPTYDANDRYMAHAAALMLDEQLHDIAREINDIPQQILEEELAAKGIGAWMEQVKSSRPYDHTAQHSVEADMSTLLKD